MKVLTMYDDANILAWLVNGDVSIIDYHIKNGYPELVEGYKAGIVKAVNIDVPDEDAYRNDLYTVAKLDAAVAEQEELIKEQRAKMLDNIYEPKFADLAQAYATALMSGDIEIAASIQADYAALKNEYLREMEVIFNDN